MVAEGWRATRRRVLAGGSTALLTAGVSGCAVGGGGRAADAGPAIPKDGPPIDVVFSRPANQAAADAYNAQATAFNAKQERLKGRFEAPALAQGETFEAKLTAMIAGASAPDVFLVGQDPLPGMAANGMLLDLDPKLKRDAKEVNTDDFFPSHLAGGKWQGRQVGLTADGCAMLTYYNITLFQQAGVPVPQPTWTWNEYLDAARRLTRKDGDTVTQAGAIPAPTGGNQFWLWLWSNGADMFSADFKQVRLTEPPALEALQFLADLIQRHGVSATSPGVSLGTNPEVMGKVGMWQQNRGFFGQLGQVTSFKVNVVPFPRSPRTGQSTTVNVAGHLGIAKNNKLPDAAWEYLKFLTGTEAQVIRSTVQQGGCPSRKSASTSPTRTSASRRLSRSRPTRPSPMRWAIPRWPASSHSTWGWWRRPRSSTSTSPPPRAASSRSRRRWTWPSASSKTCCGASLSQPRIPLSPDELNSISALTISREKARVQQKVHSDCNWGLHSRRWPRYRNAEAPR
jgi:multiple sugar transport system substrate-binding protein